MFMNTAKEKQLHFSWQIEVGVPQFVYGDPDRIYQILVNLLSNAFKFTTKGFVKVMVLNAAENEKEITLQFNVQDSGIGIPLKKQELIFERFQQAGNTEENIQKGTGLGLAIVKNMATLLGGTIAVKSAEGAGSVFTVLLPFTKNVTENNEAAAVVATDNATVIFAGAKVLVAEDNSVNQLLITKLLNQHGIEPVVKENGLEVLEVLKNQQFDLLLLDIQMPLLDGYKTCIAIRQADNVLPVVAMTAYVMDAEKEKCRAAGMNDYLAKPLDEVALKNILLKYLSAFIKSSDSPSKKNNNEFLLQLAGGDKQMAAIILNQVKQEIPVEIVKLQKIMRQKNTDALPAACHYLISSISPLGNSSKAMQMVTALQKSVADKQTETEILNGTAALISELENTFNNLK
jgi:CheY-like chemotaxis protein